MNRLDRPRQALAIGLAGLAGFVDATGFMANSGYFVSFMSGNTTRLAVNLAREPQLAVMPALILLGFLSGVVGGALVAARAGVWRKPAVLWLVAGLLLAGALLHQFGYAVPVLVMMVLAMGVLNNTFQRDGEVVVGLTYMTGALVRLGQGMAAAIIAREFVISGLRLAAIEKGIVIQARDLAKLKTWAQAFAIGFGGYSLSGAWRDDFAWWSMLVAVIFTWASAIDYARAAPQLLRSAESQGAAAAAAEATA